jgi:hypothetical protein
MNSPKHLPAFVFIMGFSLLMYSMYVFFLGSAPVAESPGLSSAVLETSRPEAPKPEEPKPEEPEPEQSVKSEPPPKPIPLPKPPRITELDRTVEISDTTARDIRDAARKPAEAYLQKAGVKMNVPDDHRYRESKDGSVEILIGTNSDGKEDFYMFTFNKKSEPVKMQKYVATYFADQAEYKMKGKPETHRNRLGLKDLMLFKGTNSDGEEFQAYSFINSKANRSHIVLLKEKDLSRQPAKIRLVVDSMQLGS